MAFFGMPGGWEWIVILVIGLLLFGRRLPEIGRSVGRSIVEFKKGIKGIEDEVEDASTKRFPPEPDSRRVSRADAVEHPSN
jgi:sec-independent protein translocase protein TatA